MPPLFLEFAYRTIWAHCTKSTLSVIHVHDLEFFRTSSQFIYAIAGSREGLPVVVYGTLGESFGGTS